MPRAVVQATEKERRMSSFVPVSEAVDDPKRLYTIQNVEVYYFTGIDRDKNQVLLDVLFPY